MNKRILKKLSKRVAPILPQLDDTREQFLAERGENYHGYQWRFERKHCERHRSRHADLVWMGLVRRPRRGDWFVHISQPHHPYKGTPMVGSRVGYYEPEWEEESTWAAFQRLAKDHFTEWKTWYGADGEPKLTCTCKKRLRTTRDYLATIPELIREHREAKEQRRKARQRAVTAEAGALEVQP